MNKTKKQNSVYKRYDVCSALNPRILDACPKLRKKSLQKYKRIHIGSLFLGLTSNNDANKNKGIPNSTIEKANHKSCDIK